MASGVNFNGNLFKSGQAIVDADNRGFRYGDGLFETMKVLDNAIMLAPYHFERLFDGLNLMQFDIPAWFSADYLTNQVISVCNTNGHQQKARVRLMVFRGQGSVHQVESLVPNFVIQTWHLEHTGTQLPDTGLSIGLYTEARKSADSFSHLKSNNYPPYLMAAMYAGKKELDDCLVLNSKGNVCESTIANFFMIRDGRVVTPPISEGCVAGVMRRHLLQKLPALGFEVHEEPVGVADLSNADEIFLSNAISGIRWVQQFEGVSYGCSAICRIYNLLSEI